jgi:hypothetical protein
VRGSFECVGRDAGVGGSSGILWVVWVARGVVVCRGVRGAGGVLRFSADADAMRTERERRMSSIMIGYSVCCCACACCVVVVRL